MDYEKKYKEALEWARKVMQGKVGFVLDEVLEKFPELKESEDEKIRKAIHIYLDWLDGKKDYAPRGEYTINDMIDWIEKQGKHQKFRDSIQVGDKVTRNEDGVLVNLSQLNRVAKKDEKQGEQKSIDDLTPQEAMNIAVAKCFEQGEQKPKFRVGDTIKCKYDDRQFTIKSVDLDKGTYTYTQEGCGNDIDYADKEFELVEQKPAFEVKTPEESLGIDSDTYNKIVDECVYGEQKPAWSEEDKRIILAIPQLLKDCESENGWNCVYSNDREVFFADIENYLQSLKNRIVPQPKQEWSEEDELIVAKILCICNDFERSFESSPSSMEVIKEDVDKIDNWLNSLKDKYTWKPSDEQMLAISTAINVLGKGTINGKYLIELQEQLKKL